ncbi:hypothetical protein [Pseudodesulfovibrio sp.]|uniref:hypothetical protein n=1 Tax=Pseudodesulfovibrio sp. TaxID=2035812 RepID=UPI0026163E1D|nr:hypothetical protein [Pseudodesulfovibrio sp.]MDD3311543.1 hypothetical protein [Pseudodesulfovibrio sp.]
MGDAGGDPDWYGYCLDDPVNGADPLGLFRFGKRKLDMPLGGLLYGTGVTELASKALPAPLAQLATPYVRKIDDKKNLQFAHEQGFWEDGSGRNIGLGEDGLMEQEKIEAYDLEGRHYDDKRMRRAVKSLGEKPTYNLCGVNGDKNNCQDFADTMRTRYGVLDRGDKMR